MITSPFSFLDQWQPLFIKHRVYSQFAKTIRAHLAQLHGELPVKLCQMVFFGPASAVKPSMKLISASTSGMKPQNVASTGFTSASLFCQTFSKTTLASSEKLLHQRS